MALSNEAVKEFKDQYLKEFDEEISDAEAKEMGENLIALFRIICRPIPEGYIPKYDQKGKEP